MKQHRQLTAWLLIAILLASFSLNSCGDQQSNRLPSDTTVADDSSTEPSEETKADTPNPSDIIKEFEKKDYDGVSFYLWASNILNSSVKMQQIPGDTETGEKINDALIKRDNTVEEYFHIDIEYTCIEPDTNSDLYERASKSIRADESVIDLMLGNMYANATSFINNSLIYDMSRVDTIDLSQSWWHQEALQNLTIDNHIYLATGDITPRYVYAPYTILFNKALFDQYQIAYPYDMVREGTWTMDELGKIIKNTYQDLNNNNSVDIDDFYGYAMDGEFYQYFNAFGEKAMDIVNGEPVISCTSESAMNKLISIADFFEDDTIWRNTTNLYDHVDIFTADRALMTPQTAGNYMLFIDMKSDFGVVPCPKYDTTQESYHAWVNPWMATAAMIPKSVDNVSRTGQIIDALAAVGKYTVTPAAYEVTLLTRQLRDEDSIEMLKIAAEGSMYDLSELFNWGDLSNSIKYDLGKGSSGIASRIESLSKRAIKMAQKTIKAVNAE